MSLVLNAFVYPWSVGFVIFESTEENSGKTVTVNYTAELSNGELFTETITRKIELKTNAPEPYYGFTGSNMDFAVNADYSPKPIPLNYYYEGEPVEVTIPTCANPFTVTVNGVTFSYPAGTTQGVPPYVAEVIESHVDMQPQEDPYAGYKVVKVANTTFYFPSGYCFGYATSSNTTKAWSFEFDKGLGMFKLGGSATGFASTMAKAEDYVHKYLILNPALITRENGANASTAWTDSPTYYGKCAILIEKVDTNGYPVGTLFMVEG